MDPDSLRFFDEESSLFNGNEVSDTADALKDAKTQSEKKLNKGDLLKNANEQAKTVIEKMYSSIAEMDSYTVNIHTTEPKKIVYIVAKRCYSCYEAWVTALFYGIARSIIYRQKSVGN